MDEMIPGAQRNCVTFSNKQTNPKTDCAVTDFKTANNMKLKKTVYISERDQRIHQVKTYEIGIEYIASIVKVPNNNPCASLLEKTNPKAGFQNKHCLNEQLFKKKEKPTVIIKNEDEVNSEFIYPSRSATIDKLSNQVIY